MVKRLRHHPFTVVSRVQFPVGSPYSLDEKDVQSFSQGKSRVYGLFERNLGKPVNRRCPKQRSRFFAFWHEAAPLYYFPRKGYYRFLRRTCAQVRLFFAANSKGQVRRFCEAKDTVWGCLHCKHDAERRQPNIEQRETWTVSGAMRFRQRRNGAERRRALPFFDLVALPHCARSIHSLSPSRLHFAAAKPLCALYSPLDCAFCLAKTAVCRALLCFSQLPIKLHYLINSQLVNSYLLRRRIKSNTKLPFSQPVIPICQFRPQSCPKACCSWI